VLDGTVAWDGGSEAGGGNAVADVGANGAETEVPAKGREPPIIPERMLLSLLFWADTEVPLVGTCGGGTEAGGGNGGADDGSGGDPPMIPERILVSLLDCSGN